MERIIKIGGLYKHFKGNIYKVVNIAYDCEDLSKKVIYADITKDKTWVRDYDNFNSYVDKNKYPNANQAYRFEEVNK